ncbi:hypothetical protein ACP275_04G134300 [Erythranthe tilingii]
MLMEMRPSWKWCMLYLKKLLIMLGSRQLEDQLNEEFMVSDQSLLMLYIMVTLFLMLKRVLHQHHKTWFTVLLSKKLLIDWWSKRLQIYVHLLKSNYKPISKLPFNHAPK